jgi:hypothetical protein
MPEGGSPLGDPRSPDASWLGSFTAGRQAPPTLQGTHHRRMPGRAARRSGQAVAIWFFCAAREAAAFMAEDMRRFILQTRVQPDAITT